MTEDQAYFVQVVNYLPNGKVRVHNIVAEESHIGDEQDPLTTIVVRGYKDVSPVENI